MHPIRSIVRHALSPKRKGKKSQPSSTRDHRPALRDGGLIAQTIATPGFKLVIDYIKNEIMTITETWMGAPAEQREELRIRALVYKEVLQQFDRFLKKREIAQKDIRRRKQNNDFEPQD